MKIAISASGSDLSSSVDPRFGRCPFFLLVDTDTMEFEAVENSNVSAMSGAGIQSAQFIANKGAKALLTGSCGPNAFQTLQVNSSLLLKLMFLPISAWEQEEVSPKALASEWEGAWVEVWVKEWDVAWAEEWVEELDPEWDMELPFSLRE